MSQRPQAIRCPRCAEKVELTLSIDPVLTYTHSARKGFLTARVGMSGIEHTCPPITEEAHDA